MKDYKEVIVVPIEILTHYEWDCEECYYRNILDLDFFPYSYLPDNEGIELECEICKSKYVVGTIDFD
jgi:hypothetical protein